MISTLVAMAACSPFSGSDSSATDAGTGPDAGTGGVPAEGGGPPRTCVQPFELCQDFEGVMGPLFGATRRESDPVDPAMTFTLVDDSRRPGHVLQSELKISDARSHDGFLSYPLGVTLLGDNKRIRLSFSFQVEKTTTAYAVLAAFNVSHKNGQTIFGISTYHNAVGASSDQMHASGLDDQDWHTAVVTLSASKPLATNNLTVSWTAMFDGKPIATNPVTFTEAVGGLDLLIGQFYTGTEASDTIIRYDDIKVDVP